MYVHFKQKKDNIHELFSITHDFLTNRKEQWCLILTRKILHTLQQKILWSIACITYLFW